MYAHMENETYYVRCNDCKNRQAVTHKNTYYDISGKYSVCEKCHNPINAEQ